MYSQRCGVLWEGENNVRQGASGDSYARCDYGWKHDTGLTSSQQCCLSMELGQVRAAGPPQSSVSLRIAKCDEASRPQELQGPQLTLSSTAVQNTLEKTAALNACTLVSSAHSFGRAPLLEEFADHPLKDILGR